ncbi:MAG: hypothetical protein HYT70_00625 [Candidatus Aenigmarchaeota archaeon]|nr:hypothetical protein [Candidatus Aenigmarchaeota archaeon]
MAVEYEVVNNVIRINCINWAIAPSVEDSEATMAIVIDKLLQVPDAIRVALVEARENEYDEEQTRMLREIADVYNRIVNVDKILSMKNMAPPQFEKLVPKRLGDLQFLVLEVLRKENREDGEREQGS